MLKTKPFVFALLAFAPILALLLIMSRSEYFWLDWKPATCMPAACFCEAIQSGTIAQPANTWSSLGFVLIGLLILMVHREDAAINSPRRGWNRMTDSHAYALVYGTSLILIGLGSAFYHASLTFLGQFFDVMGMYLLACFILLYNLLRVRQFHSMVFVILYVVMNSVLAFFLITLPEWRRYLFAVLILGALILAYLPRRGAETHVKRNYLAGAFLAIVLAFLVFLLDLTKIFCWPQSWLQGHALWHLGGALSAGLLFEHYRNERS